MTRDIDDIFKEHMRIDDLFKQLNDTQNVLEIHNAVEEMDEPTAKALLKKYIYARGQ